MVNPHLLGIWLPNNHNKLVVFKVDLIFALSRIAPSENPEFEIIVCCGFDARVKLIGFPEKLRENPACKTMQVPAPVVSNW